LAVYVHDCEEGCLLATARTRRVRAGAMCELGVWIAVARRPILSQPRRPSLPRARLTAPQVSCAPLAACLPCACLGLQAQLAAAGGGRAAAGNSSAAAAAAASRATALLVCGAKYINRLDVR
jgi:hypothetical protein